MFGSEVVACRDLAWFRLWDGECCRPCHEGHGCRGLHTMVAYLPEAVELEVCCRGQQFLGDSSGESRAVAA